MFIEKSIKKWLYSSSPLNLNDDVKSLIEKEINPSSYLKETLIIIHKLSNKPWCTQKEILEETELQKNEIIKLNEIIRNSELLQDIIMDKGVGRKYWKTIIPMIRSKSIDNTLNHKYNFPLRIGIYPGISCMFYCGFCGRNQKAYYPGDIQEDSFEMFKTIFKNMPKSSTISISGGLEPLTHKKIGDIISYAKKCGIRVPLITNFHNGTPKFVKKHPGLLNLDSLRVSLYGVDEESTFEITRKKGAYKLVKNNIIEFLKIRNEVNPNLKLGLNYIIIPENVNHISRLMDYIIEVNSEVDNGRGIDYITIREDFGSVTDTGVDDVRLEGKAKEGGVEGFLSKEHRIGLMKSFKEFQKKKEKYCPDLNVDFGYALDALSQGVFVDQIKMVDGSEMRKSAYPQVSVAVDSFGDVFLYREAGFLDRPGNDKFIIGRISEEKSFENIVREFVESKYEISNKKDDSRFMDAFDHVVTILINQLESDKEIGIPFNLGPVLSRCNQKNEIDANTKKKGLFGTFHQ
mgnify:CR=1 FL=1